MVQQELLYTSQGFECGKREKNEHNMVAGNGPGHVALKPYPSIYNASSYFSIFFLVEESCRLLIKGGHHPFTQ